MQFFKFKKSAPTLFVITFVILNFTLTAQVKPLPADTADIIQPVHNRNWILIKEGVQIDSKKFISNYKKLLNLKEADGLRLYKTETDEYGITHNRYLRIYKNYPIAGRVLLFHSKGNQLESINGDIDIAIQAQVNIQLTKEQSIERAKSFFPADKYAWENPNREKDKKEMMHDSKATYYPEAPLVWQKKSEIEPYVLCYQVDIVTNLIEGKRFFISSTTGELINSYSLSTKCTATSSATNFYGNRSFFTKQVNVPGIGNTYSLWNDCNIAFIHTLRFNDSTDYYSVNNTWSQNSSPATSHWAAQQAASYFLNVHQRLSWNNLNAGCYVYQRLGWDNASALSGNIIIGEANSISYRDDNNTLDIVAHEYAHLVTETSAGLVYKKEQGALNESFSDIFGVACYEFNFGITNTIWLNGYDRTDVTNPNLHLVYRDLSNPKNYDQPDTYLGTNWYSTTGGYGDDNWGVHTNSGVQNYMFYLLVSGKDGVNENGWPYSVTGIGFNDARRIAYLALTAYLTNNSQYIDARNAWVQAARTIFGSCSNQAIQTGKAWEAVGLPSPASYNFVGNYTTTSNIQVNGTANLATPSPMTIQSGAQYSIGAKAVHMLPGFKAFSGSYFHAYINDCFYAAL